MELPRARIRHPGEQRGGAVGGWLAQLLLGRVLVSLSHFFTTSPLHLHWQLFRVQWAVLLNGFWERVVEMAEHGNDTHGAFERLPLNIGSFIRSDYSAATVLISYGAVIGRVSPLQMVVVLVWEVIWSTANEAVGTLKLGASDPGGACIPRPCVAAAELLLCHCLSPSTGTAA